MKNLSILLALVTTLALAADNGLPITAANRTGLNVTVYNDDLALVKDKREITVPKSGRQALLFIDIPKKIQATSTIVKNLQRSAQWQVLEQNYRYDLITSHALLAGYVGRELVLITYNSDNQVQERVKAKLLALNDKPIYQIGDQIYLDHPGAVILPDAPENLVAAPGLEWLVNADQGTHNIEVSYLTAGLAWQADYTLQVEADYTAANLSIWATVTNSSGMAYPDATLKLVAGTVNRAAQQRPVYARLEMSAAKAAAPPQREEFLDYHLFDVPGQVTLRQAQTKQLELYPPVAVKVERSYRLEIANANNR